MRALFVLTPAESKRLIGKAVSNLPEVKHAQKNDHLLISHGSTNVYVTEEILGKDKTAALFDRNTFLSGLVVRGTLCSTYAKEKGPILLMKNGKIEPPAPNMSEMLQDFGKDSVFLKGASAVDVKGNAAVFMAHPEGGTIGWGIGTILARGIRLIVPVGLEKLVASVEQSVGSCGQQTFDYCQGLKVGMMPLSGAKVITEIDALKILTGVECIHVASGGSSGTEGAVVLVAEGEKEVVETAIRVVESVKGEPPLKPRKGVCEICGVSSPAQGSDYKTEGLLKRCPYEKMTEVELPEYLKDR
ncbi:hypothetical protein ACFLZL_00640 [Thermodesulfobacteriota bacterium]